MINLLNNKTFTFWVKYLITFGFAITLVLLFFLIPFIYNVIYGPQIINKHLSEVIGNKTDHAEVASALINWIHEEVVYPTDKDKVLIFGLDFDLYNAHNHTIFFFRDSPASWTIRTKMGRCGEDARYFVEMMTKLGYKSRIIKPSGWDHSWADYYSPDGVEITLDPSSDQIIIDKIGWAAGKNVTKIEAFPLKGKPEDISRDYGINVSRI